MHNLKELRPRTPAGSEIRMLFVFDPTREAIVLGCGGQVRPVESLVPRCDPPRRTAL
ncbi:hypothetical protein ACQPXH_08710 [Nocardia sp. CA-135953]|uniref:hypothetical protein n=1 Tax=Nocardia sp. CA-135953 TaxID=3239978 RepID=UPI003D9604F5